MLNVKINISITSNIATLKQLEAVLGTSCTTGWSIGQLRSNGLSYKQSRWTADFRPGNEFELSEECVDVILDQLKGKIDALRKLDSEAFCKIYCELASSAAEDSPRFAVNPEMAGKLASMNVLLLVSL